jgi:ribosome maturation factor RimP
VWVATDALAHASDSVYMRLAFSTLETLPRLVPPGAGWKALDISTKDRMTDIADIARLIEPEAKALGLALVRVKMNGGRSDPTLQVMAERPDTRQLDLSDCEALSRRISEVLDQHDPIEEAYRLEVSSPGIDRPLTRLADFDDWAGFDARVRLVDKIDGRKHLDGRILGTEGSTVRFMLSKDAGEFSADLSDIASAKLILTDALIKATAPLSTDGADKIIEIAPDDGDDSISKEG